MGIFDSFDGDDGNNSSHWLNDWRVQLPVNKQGKPSGQAVMNHNPADPYKPWWDEKAKTCFFRCPAEGAGSSPGISPRCELSQVPHWSVSNISFNLTVDKCGDRTTFLQCKDERNQEVIQLRCNGDSNTFEIQLNEGADKRTYEGFELGKTFPVKAKVERGGDASVTVDGKTYFARLRHKHQPNAFTWKLGIYNVGRNGEAISKVTHLKWSG